MRHESLFAVLAFSAVSQAAPAQKRSKAPFRTLYNREVPQEHSHNTFLASVRTSLALDNPDNIQDPVFGLLGNGAAAAGQGSISDTDCLHQATADQAFTNAKAAGDVDGMTNTLIYAALERNTGKVGLASVLCTAIEATNPEIAAISQHQDPASPGATATNKAITLELAKQIASVGGDPQEALKSGTFAPGEINDPTAAGNSCNTIDDEPGCIFTQNLLIEDATPEEIDAAVAGTEAPAESSASESGTSSAALPAGTGDASLDAEDSSAAPFPNKTASAASTNDTKLKPAKNKSSAAINDKPLPLSAAALIPPSSSPRASMDARKRRSHRIMLLISFMGVLRLKDKCKAGAEAVAACEQGKEAAATLKGQDAADAFNAALGGEAGAANVDEEGNAVDGGDDEEVVEADACNAASSSTSAAAAESSNPAVASKANEAKDDEENQGAAANSDDLMDAAASSSDNTADAEAPQGGNLQTFTGSLGGLPPPVSETAGADKPFSVTVKGKTVPFPDKAAALDRSCSVQHNACADASNSGQIQESVGQCGEQEKECKAIAATAA
ncbi:MAG: hypothetical protein Q9221_005151 [Calogaya cf. arnoldii]